MILLVSRIAVSTKVGPILYALAGSGRRRSRERCAIDREQQREDHRVAHQEYPEAEHVGLRLLMRVLAGGVEIDAGVLPVVDDRALTAARP